MRVEEGALNVGRKRDPRGNYVAVTDVKTYEVLKDVISMLEMEVENSGNVVFIASRSWSRMSKLMREAESRGVKVMQRS